MECERLAKMWLSEHIKKAGNFKNFVQQNKVFALKDTLLFDEGSNNSLAAVKIAFVHTGRGAMSLQIKEHGMSQHKY